MSESELYQRDLKTANHVPSFAIIYHHPGYGAIRVGHIGKRNGNPNGTDNWSWTIGWGTLNGREHRQGTEATKKACETEWKKAWPAFKAARSDTEWYEAKSTEDYASRKWDIFDARKYATVEEEKRLTAELSKFGPGPTPKWVMDIKARGQR